jgi:hypothetical protein
MVSAVLLPFGGLIPRYTTRLQCRTARHCPAATLHRLREQLSRFALGPQPDLTGAPLSFRILGLLGVGFQRNGLSAYLLDLVDLVGNLRSEFQGLRSVGPAPSSSPLPRLKLGWWRVTSASTSRNLGA